MNYLKLIGRKAIFAIVGSVICGISLSFLEIFLAFLFQSLLVVLGVSQDKMVLYGFEFPTVRVEVFLVILVIVGSLRSIVIFLVAQLSAFFSEVIFLRLRQLALYDALMLESGYLSLSKINTQFGEIFPKTGHCFHYLSLFASQFIYSVFLLFLMFFANINLTLYSLVWIIVIGIFVHFVNKYVRIVSEGRPSEYRNLSEKLTQIIKNFFLVKAFKTVDMEYKKLSNISLSYGLIGLKANFWVCFGGALPQIMGIFLIAALVLYQVNHAINPQIFIAFLYLIFRFIQNLGTLASTFGVISMSYPNLRRSLEFFLTIPEDCRYEALSPVSTFSLYDLLESKRVSERRTPNDKKNEVKLPEILIKNLSYRYPRSDKYILKDFNLHIHAGMQIGIKGKSGSGKSTLLALLLGIIKPESGNILINNLSIKKYYENFNNKVGYVGADPYLVLGSVRENLHYGSEIQYSDKECIEILKKVKLDDWILSVKNPLDYLLSEFGEGMSTGQKQRLSLARALLRAPSLMILDEISANLDYETEFELANLLNTIKGECTTIIVSHRDGILKNVDKRIEI